ncbi:DUF4595 domain-containing protein [Pedobacter sp. V48]|uniref:DUF4595 domain-containing protein n=1 Tax=Pedobacter sp. V48 TaxID=509635 RepID=UPI0003E54221|nr:DUF4595 domain-containing protein [Pedobacter sp. V48]ETZ24630.1 hypothetical protein N824_14025 [Pedobacter sp. V48]
MKKTGILMLSMAILAVSSCKKDKKGTLGSCLLTEGRFTSDNETQIVNMEYDALGRVILVKSEGREYANYVHSTDHILLTEKIEEGGVVHDYPTNYGLDSQRRISVVTTPSSKTTYTYNPEGYLIQSAKVASTGDYTRVTNLTYSGGNLTKIAITIDGILREVYTYIYGAALQSANFRSFDSIQGLEDYAGLLKNSFGKSSKNQVIKSVFQSLYSSHPNTSPTMNYTYIKDEQGNIIGFSGTSDEESFQIAYKYNCE